MMTYIDTHKQKNPSSHSSKINILDRSFLGIYCFVRKLSDLIRSETRRGEEIFHIHYMTTSKHTIYNFVRLVLGHHYHTLSVSDLCLSEEKKFLKEIMYFHLWLIWPRPSTGISVLGLWNLQFWYTLPWTSLLYPQFV